MDINEDKNKNIEAENRFTFGVFGMIPAWLVAGPVGIVGSLIAGIAGANASNKKKKRAKYNSMRYIPTEKRRYNKQCETNKLEELRKVGNKYALMTNKECHAYFEKIREEYPMEAEGISYSNPEYLGCYVGDSGHKTAKIIIGYDNNNKPKYDERDFEVIGKFNQEIVELLEKAKKDGLNIKWIKINTQLHPNSYKKTLYYYKVESDWYIYSWWFAPFDYINSSI